MKITSGGQILNNDVIRQAIELLDTSVCITDIHTNILYVNKYFEKQTVPPYGLIPPLVRYAMNKVIYSSLLWLNTI